MQAAKNMAATVKQKVDMMRGHGDEAAKDEATAMKNEREEAGAEQHREAEQGQNAEDKERVVNPHPGRIGDKPTPADLDRVMGADNPSNPANPESSSGNNATAKATVGPGPTVPNYLGPSSGGQVA